MLRIDVHQHLWSETLVAALARRKAAPFIRRDGHGWELTVPGEPPSTIDVVGDAIPTRDALLHLDGLDLALLSLSTIVGVESLPGDEAEEVIDGYETGLGALPASFSAWGALPLREALPADVDRLIDRGFAG